MIDYKAEKKIKIPKEVSAAKEVSAGAAVTLTFINQIFAFIGGTVVFQHIFHVPVYMGTEIIALFYGALIFLFYKKL